MIKWTTILLSVVGLSVGIYAVSTAEYAPPPMPLAAAPSINPYEHGIACSGLVEAASRNIEIAPLEGGGLVTKLFVEVGDQVEAGQPLFELDTRPLQSDLLRARADVAVASASLARLQAQPRLETIPPLRAAVQAMEAEYADWEDQYTSLQAAERRDAASTSELQRRYFQLQGSKARLEQAKAELALAEAGAWAEDVGVARAQLDQARAAVQAIELLIERRTVKSPVDGTVLKRNIVLGEFADTNAPSLVVGDLSSLNVRASVDEEDLPLLRDGAKGVARLRGRAEITVPLTMVRIEPLARPKTTLSGSTTERVDTRVLEVLFAVAGPSEPPVRLYPGQLVDVFIEGYEPGKDVGKK